MSFQEDLNTLHNFLLQTPESNLKRMLIEGKMTEVHLRLLVKIAKNTGHEDFKRCYENKEFPRIKTTAAENNIKETFWDICAATLQTRGLIGATPMPQAA